MFSNKVRKMLQEISLLPWKVTPTGGIAVEGTCPLCAMANAKSGEDLYRYDVYSPSVVLGIHENTGWAIATAADYPNDPNRKELMQLLGMTS